MARQPRRAVEQGGRRWWPDQPSTSLGRVAPQTYCTSGSAPFFKSHLAPWTPVSARTQPAEFRPHKNHPAWTGLRIAGFDERAACVRLWPDNEEHPVTRRGVLRDWRQGRFSAVSADEQTPPSPL